MHCYTREVIELTAILFGLVSYGLGIALQPSVGTNISQLYIGIALAPVGAIMCWFWHRRVTVAGPELHHEGFKWHLVADMAGAIAIAPCGIIAATTHWAGINFWGAVAVLALTAILCVQPALGVIARLSHCPSRHIYDPAPNPARDR